MYNNLNVKQRKFVARKFVDMVYQDEDSKRNLHYVWMHLAKPVLGVSYKTFLSYLDAERDDLQGIMLPDYLLLGMWTSASCLVEKKPVVFPDEMVRRLENSRVIKARKKKEMQERMSLAQPTI